MKTLLKTIFGLGAFALVACATSPGQKDDAAQKARAQAYLQGVQSQRAIDSSGRCHAVPTNTKNVTGAQSWKTLVEEANACVKAADWASVENWAFEISRTSADSPWGLYYYSVAAEATHDYPRAMWMIEAAMKKSSSDVAVFRFQKSRVMWSLKPTEGALKEAQAALDIDSSLIDAHNFLGDARFRAADFKTAAQHYEAALKISADDAHARKGLEMVHVQTGQTPERAVATATSAPTAKKASSEGAK